MDFGKKIMHLWERRRKIMNVIELKARKLSINKGINFPLNYYEIV